jgi:hypothetical protein
MTRGRVSAGRPENRRLLSAAIIGTGIFTSRLIANLFHSGRDFCANSVPLFSKNGINLLNNSVL